MEELPLDLPDSEMEADDGADDRKEAAEEAEGQVQAASSCDCCPEADESCWPRPASEEQRSDVGVVKEAARLLLLETAGDQAGADQQVVLPDSDNTA